MYFTDFSLRNVGYRVLCMYMNHHSPIRKAHTELCMFGWVLQYWQLDTHSFYSSERCNFERNDFSKWP